MMATSETLDLQDLPAALRVPARAEIPTGLTAKTEHGAIQEQERLPV